MSVDEGCSSFSVLGLFVGVYLMMCNMILILTGHNKVLECIWNSVVFTLFICSFRSSDQRSYRKLSAGPSFRLSKCENKTKAPFVHLGSSDSGTITHEGLCSGWGGVHSLNNL